MSPIEAYLADVRRHLIGMDPAVRKDILEELRAHVFDMARETQQSVDEVLSKMDSPREVGKNYRELYGYGLAFRVLFAVVAALISVLSVPIFLPSFEGVEGPVWLSVIFFGLVTLYLIWVSVIAGKRVGMYSGILACGTRFITIGLMLGYYSEAVVGGFVGVLSFAISSLFLIGIGYLPGEAKKRWERRRSPII
ncbi:MAG: hypothetical protein ACE5KV_00460 [Thermoplasmata archaeon]